MTKEFRETLRHDDFMYSTDLCTSKRWIEIFMASLTHLENSKYRYLTSGPRALLKCPQSACLIKTTHYQYKMLHTIYFTDPWNRGMGWTVGHTIYGISGQSSPACRFNFYHNNTLLTKDMPLDIELQHIKSSASSQIQTLAFLLQNSIKILG